MLLLIFAILLQPGTGVPAVRSRLTLSQQPAQGVRTGNGAGSQGLRLRSPGARALAGPYMLGIRQLQPLQAGCTQAEEASGRLRQQLTEALQRERALQEAMSQAQTPSGRGQGLAESPGAPRCLKVPWRPVWPAWTGGHVLAANTHCRSAAAYVLKLPGAWGLRSS